MNGIKIISLYSGSGGNSTLISTPGGQILIDAGKSARALCAALREAGTDIGCISAFFVTHEHIDHISALEVLSKKHRIPIHMTCASADNARFNPNGIAAAQVVRHPPHFTESVGDMKVRSFCASHDSAMCVGYRVDISVSGSSFSFGLATDTGYVTDEINDGLCGCEAVLIESNHDVDMLIHGCYPPDTKRRILSRFGHLSNEDCAAFAGRLAKNGTHSFLLGHISEDNNRPDFAAECVINGLRGCSNVSVMTAKPDAATVIV